MLFQSLKQSPKGLRLVSSEIKSQLKGSSKNGEVTSLDILRWREQQNEFQREEKIGGQKVKWNYRSEFVKRHGMDNNHRYTWVAIGISIIFGFASFVAVKTSVIENRRQAMQERDVMRKTLQLQGEDRKKIGIV